MIKSVNYFTFKDKVEYVAKFSNLTDELIANVVDLPVDLVTTMRENANDENWLESVSFETAEKIDKKFNALIKAEAFKMNVRIKRFKRRERLYEKRIKLLRKEVDKERWGERNGK